VHDAETPRIEVAPSAEAFIAAAEDAPRMAADAVDDMAEYLGEIFVEGTGVGNDVALDMETLQPVATATVPPPPRVLVGPAISMGPVRDLMAEFDDAPTLPEAPQYLEPERPDVGVMARFADFDEAQRPRVRVSGR
jgi:hypothetical protein